MCGLLVAPVALLGLAGCAPAKPSAHGTQRISLVEHDFGLVASPASFRAGSVTFDVENRGPSTHELVIDKTSAAATALPLEANGLQINEDSRVLHEVGSIEELRVHASSSLTLRLKPGHYVVYCNLEGHYLGGMHVALNVT